MSMLKKKINYKEGYLVTIENSRRLQKIAELSYNRKSFGTGCALNILSCEESIKSGYLIDECYQLGHKIKKYDKLFTNHSYKHKQIKSFLRIEFMIIDTVKNYNREKETELAEDGLTSREIKSFLKKDKFYNYTTEKIKSIELKNIDLAKANDWFNKANSLKQNGFYVGHKGGYWYSPKNITEKDYLESRKYAQVLIELNELNYAKVFMDLR